MDGSSSGGGNGHRVEAERWLSISEKLLSAPTIAVHSSKYGQQECFGIFLQLRDQVLPPNLDIYCAFFCDPASNMGSREVSLIMEGSLIQSAIASHYGMLYYTWSPMYLCLLLERTWSCLPLRNACFPLRLHPKMYSPMLRYSLLTLALKAICHLIYPFRWKHVYTPLLFFSGVDYCFYTLYDGSPFTYWYTLQWMVNLTAFSLSALLCQGQLKRVE